MYFLKAARPMIKVLPLSTRHHLASVSPLSDGVSNGQLGLLHPEGATMLGFNIVSHTHG